MKIDADTRAGAPAARRRLAAALAFLLAPGIVAATEPDSFHATFDTAVRADDAGVVKRGQLLLRRYQATPAIVDLGIPANVQFAALAVSGDDVFYSPDASFMAGSLRVTPRDIARRSSSGVTTIQLSGDVIGLPATARIDALVLSGSDILFSVDVPARVAALAVGSADILRWNGSSVSILYSAQALGLPAGLNVSALERLSNGDLLVGFDSAGKVGGVSFKAGEVLDYSPATGHWAMWRQLSLFGVQCAPCRPGDFAASVNPDLIFRSGIERYEG